MSVLKYVEIFIDEIKLTKINFYENFDRTARSVFRGIFPDLDYVFSRIVTFDYDQYFYLYGDVVFEVAFGSQETSQDPEEIVVVYLYGIDQDGECEPYEVGNIFELSLYRLAVVVGNNPDVNFDGHRVKRWLCENKVTVPLSG